MSINLSSPELLRASKSLYYKRDSNYGWYPYVLLFLVFIILYKCKQK